MIVKRPRGFTLIELAVALGIFATFLGLASAEIVWLARASGTASRGSAEMLSATRFVERYRNDVRQARSVEIGNKDASVALTLSDGVIEYRANEGRLERVHSVSGEADTGPFVREIHFLLENAAAGGHRHLLLHAKWECLAEINPRPNASEIQSAGARILILNTALRMEAGASGKRER